MKFFAFTKIGLIRILISSLMLSVYVSAIILNFASREITVGCFFATMLFVFSLTGFSLFAKMKNHPPLYKTAKGWLTVSLVMCIVAFIVSSAEAEVSGFFGSILGFGVMAFVSPFYGFAYLFKNGIAVSVAGAVSCVLIYFLPKMIERIIKRRKLAKKYE